MRVLVTDSEASKIGEIQPKNEKLVFRYIRGILENESSNGRITDITFNEFVSSIGGFGNGLLPKISIKSDEAKIAGTGLVKDFKLIGYLSEADSYYFNSMMGKRKAGSTTVNIEDLTIDYVIRDSSRSIKLINDDPNNLDVSINLKTEGVVQSAEANEEIFNDELIKKAEQELNKLDEESCKSVIQKLQKEYKLDALSIGEYIRKFHPSVWDNVKDKWEEIYPNIKITPIVDNKIRRIGTVK
jgi:Ger(x)C family germination protein